MGVCVKIAFITLYGLGIIHMQSEDGEDQECERVTLRGCECAGQWMHDQMVFSGCAKTNDKATEWCQIKPGSCVEDKSSALLDRFVDGISERDGQPEWDFCSPGCKIPEEQLESSDICLTYTENGCRCLKTWTFMDQEFEGCENPDSDQAGAWCIIEPQTCSEGSGPVTVFPVKGLQFDYCRQDLNCSPPISQSTFNATIPTPVPTPIPIPSPATILTPYDPPQGLLPVNTMQSSEVTVSTEGGLLTPVNVEISAPIPSSNDMFLDVVTQVIGGSQNAEQTSLGVLESAQGAYSSSGYEEVEVGPSPQNSLGNIDPSTLLQDTIIDKDTDVFEALLGYTNRSSDTAGTETQQLKQVRDQNADINPDLFVASLSAINTSSLVLLPLNDSNTPQPLLEVPILEKSPFTQETTPTFSTNTSNFSAPSANLSVASSPLLTKTRTPSPTPALDPTPTPSFSANSESAASRIVISSPPQVEPFLNPGSTPTFTPIPNSVLVANPNSIALLSEQVAFEDVPVMEYQMQMLEAMDTQISRLNNQININGLNQSVSSPDNSFFAGRSVSFEPTPTIILGKENLQADDMDQQSPQNSNQTVLMKQPVKQASEEVDEFDGTMPEIELAQPRSDGKENLNCSEFIGQSEFNVSLFSSLSEKLGILNEFKGTVFLPTNEAFEEFLEEQQITVSDLFRFQSNLGLIEKVLNSHVVSKNVKSLKQLKKKSKLQNMEGQQIAIQSTINENIIVIPPYEDAEKAEVIGSINGIQKTCGFYGYVINQVIIPDISV